jgi:glycosyltransferase involved in cell wall biosynthesis
MYINRHQKKRKTMNVLMITGVYFPEITGASFQCKRVVESLKSKVNFSVLTATRDASLVGCSNIDGVSVCRFGVAYNGVSLALLVLKILLYFVKNRRRFDIVHLHGFSSKSILVIIISKILGKRIVLKMTSYGHDDPISIKSNNRLMFSFYSLCDAYIGIAPIFQKKYIESGLDLKKYFHIPNGVDTSVFSPVNGLKEKFFLRLKYNIPSELKLILFVGHFSKEKAADHLLDVWLNKVYQVFPKSGIIFIGNDDTNSFEVDKVLIDALKSKVKEFTGKNIFFIKNTHDIEEFYKLSDVYVLTSSREGLPNSLLEAMSCQLPVISTKLNGVTDWILKHNIDGKLYNFGDLNSLSLHLLHLLDDSNEKDQMCIRAREKICDKFEIINVSNEIFRVYKKLIT